MDNEPLTLENVEKEIAILELERQYRAALVKDAQADHRDAVKALDMLYTKRWQMKREQQKALFRREDKS